MSRSRSASLTPDPEDSPSYPAVLRAREVDLLKARRKVIAEDPAGTPVPEGPIGIAFSGGGIRSATFNLGVVQALAQARLLRAVDYLSTVSGGGYTGAFLGRLYTRYLNRPKGAPTAIERRLSDAGCDEIEWLRQNGHYLAPAGRGDTLVNVAIAARNFLAVHVVVWMFCLGIYGVVNLLRFSLIPGLTAWVDTNFMVGAMQANVDLPMSHLLRAAFPGSVSPWTLLVEAIALLWIVPLATAYWLTSEKEAERYEPATLLAVLFVAAALILAMFGDGEGLGHGIAISVSLLLSFLYVERAWRRVRVEMPGGLRHPSTRPAVRNFLTTWLGSAAGAGITAAAFALIDTVGFNLFQLVRGPDAYLAAFSKMLGGFAVLYPILRFLARWVATLARPSTAGGGRTVFRILTHPAVLAIVLGGAPLIAISFVSHALFQEGRAIGLAAAATAVLLVASFLLGRRGALPIVNRSSLQSVYAARIARAYLGASNAVRHGTERGRNVTTTQPDDDVSLHAYRPDLAGGPLHLINICLNETLEHASQRTIRDRQSESLAIGPVGVSVGPTAHGLWEESERFGAAQGRVRAAAVVELPHPFVGDEKDPVIRTEALSLGAWTAISGAAISPGRGAETHVGLSILFSLANLRAGYWWDTRLEDNRRGVVEAGLGARIAGLPRRWFRTQTLFLDEITARFSGPWRRFWYLSDGGFFENLGGYELVRRRLPVIVCSDASQDLEGRLDGLGNLVRKVRIDFGAEVRFLTQTELAGLSGKVPPEVLNALGSLDDLRPDAAGRSRRSAAIARVYYDGAPKPGSVLLYLKASLTGTEEVDVLQYHAEHPDFPHESTGDQFFDEAQWESYRKLGLHVASKLFPPGQPFWMTGAL
jgi:hypothetical protein